MSKIFEYDDDIYMVSRWIQDIIGYHFSILHRPDRMIIDINSFALIFGNLTTQCVQIETLLSNYDIHARSEAHTDNFKDLKHATKTPVSPDSPPVLIPILITVALSSASAHECAT